MNEHAKQVIAVIALLSSVVSAGCSSAIQIGGKQNSIEQNRQAPVSNRSEVATATPQPVAPEPQPTTTPEEQEPQQTVADDNQNQNELAQEELQLRRARLDNEQREIETQRLELAARQAQAQANLRQQQEILEQRTRAANEQLAQWRQQQVQPNRVEANNTSGPLPLVQEMPKQQRIYSQNPTLSPCFGYAFETGDDCKEDKKKGHSTRNKVIAGSAIGGAALFGYLLGRRH